MQVQSWIMTFPRQKYVLGICAHALVLLCVFTIENVRRLKTIKHICFVFSEIWKTCDLHEEVRKITWCYAFNYYKESIKLLMRRCQLNDQGGLCVLVWTDKVFAEVRSANYLAFQKASLCLIGWQLFEVAVKLSSLSWKAYRNVVDLERPNNTTVELFAGNKPGRQLLGSFKQQSQSKMSIFYLAKQIPTTRTRQADLILLLSSIKNLCVCSLCNPERLHCLLKILLTLLFSCEWKNPAQSFFVIYIYFFWGVFNLLWQTPD